MGVATGCGCKEVYRFPHTTYPYSSCICSFLSSIPTFCSFFKCFSFLFQYFFVITFYHMYKIFFFAQYKHTYGQLRASHGSHMKAAHTVLYMKHTKNACFISSDGHQLYERGVDLEVEGMHYIDMHRGPATYVLGPPPSRGRYLELEGGVNACHVEYV